MSAALAIEPRPHTLSRLDRLESESIHFLQSDFRAYAGRGFRFRSEQMAVENCW